MSSVYLLFILCVQLGLYSKATDVFLSKSWVAGGGGFFKVKRAKLEEQLGIVNDKYAKNGISFHLPPATVMQLIIPDIALDEHVISINIAHDEAISFSNIVNDDRYTTTSTMFVVGIPLLSTTINGAPEVGLVMKTFRSENGGKRVIDANAVLPPDVKHVDRLVITDRLLRFKDGDLELEMEQKTMSEECQHPVVQVVDEVNTAEKELVMSVVAPDFSVCQEEENLVVDFCNVYREHSNEITSAGNDVCEYLRPTPDVETCSAKYQITKISGEMKDLLMLEDGALESVAAVVQTGTFDVHIKFPCKTQQPPKRRYLPFM